MIAPLCIAGVAPAAEPTSTVVLASEVEWQALNPARGDQSPLAGTLWGDRNGTGPTGFLLKPVDGFESPPHIHNVSYRGVVISGLIHNDDANADRMWMPSGSFWTQPLGAAHITAAQGTHTLAYIEIDAGPYLVHPVDEAFDSGEVPINVHVSNLVWMDPAGRSGGFPGTTVAHVWGDPGEGAGGSLVQLPPGGTTTLRSRDSAVRAVVIQGRAEHRARGTDRTHLLDPGSLVSSQGAMVHRLSCEQGAPCILYVHSAGHTQITRR